MAQTAPTQEVFEQWKKQMEDGVKAWTRAAGQAGSSFPSGQPADAFQMWRPFLEQAAEAWAKTAQPGGVQAPDVTAQGQAFFDQWVAVWDKVMSDTMQTEAFAEALGKQLDKWLDIQGPAKKAAADATESTLQNLGLPSRTQVVGLARQMRDLDDRLDDIEDLLGALRTRLDGAPGATRSAKPAGSKGPAKGSAKGTAKRSAKSSGRGSKAVTP